MADVEILKETTFPSVIHDNEICDELVKWGNENGYPVEHAKKIFKWESFAAFSPNDYFIQAKRLPPIPGGWAVTVEKYEGEERYIPLNVPKDTGEVNRFILKMMDQYKMEGLRMELADTWYESYGSWLRDLKVYGHPFLVNQFEDFIENMR
mgnify:FL=1